MLTSLLTEKPLTLLKRYWLVLAFLLIVLLGVFSYAFGLRLTATGIVRAGTLSLTELPAGTAVYTDQSRVTGARNGKAEVDLLPGNHTVIVDAPGMQPWNELFMITAGKTTTLHPLLVPKDPEARILSGDERAQAVEAILNHPLPTKTAPLALSEGCALIYVVGSRVVAQATSTPGCTPPEYLLCPTEEGAARTEACSDAIVIYPPPSLEFTSGGLIESVSAFPGRDDAVVITAGSNAYVARLDPRTPFYAPILKGARVRAAPWSETSIVISDTKQVYELVLSN